MNNCLNDEDNNVMNFHAFFCLENGVEKIGARFFASAIVRPPCTVVVDRIYILYRYTLCTFKIKKLKIVA